MILTHPAFWGLHGNMGFTFRASLTDLSESPYKESNMTYFTWLQWSAWNLVQTSVTPLLLIFQFCKFSTRMDSAVKFCCHLEMQCGLYHGSLYWLFFSCMLVLGKHFPKVIIFQQSTPPWWHLMKFSFNWICFFLFCSVFLFCLFCFWSWRGSCLQGNFFLASTKCEGFSLVELQSLRSIDALSMYQRLSICGSCSAFGRSKDTFTRVT